MSDLLIPAAYVAGVLTGHVVVTWVKTKIVNPLHAKLDALMQKTTTTFSRGK
jgi:hypothetical protein